MHISGPLYSVDQLPAPFSSVRPTILFVTHGSGDLRHDLHGISILRVVVVVVRGEYGATTPAMRNLIRYSDSRAGTNRVRGH